VHLGRPGLRQHERGGALGSVVAVEQRLQGRALPGRGRRRQARLAVQRALAGGAGVGVLHRDRQRAEVVQQGVGQRFGHRLGGTQHELEHGAG